MFIDFILHLDKNLLLIVQKYDTATYGILFLIIFCETGLVVTPFLPGDSLLFTAGLFARAGYFKLSYLLILLFIAAVAGDNLNYWIGRKLGIKVFDLKFKNKVLVKKKYLHQTHDFFEKYGTKAIIMARFVPFVRTFAPFAAGIGEMKYAKYLPYDLAGGVLWIGSLTTAGYLLGEVTIIREHIDLFCLGIIFLSLIPVIVSVIRAKSKA